ncbi:regucalcin-like [Saccoglossus kowalevskii]
MGPEQNPTQPIVGQGTFYSLDKDHNVRCHFDKVGISNGIAWNSDNTIMYFIDTPLNRVDAFDFDLEQGTLGNRRTVVTFPDGNGFPDGMCTDVDGMLWVAMFYGSVILRIDPLSAGSDSLILLLNPQPLTHQSQSVHSYVYQCMRYIETTACLFILPR